MVKNKAESTARRAVMVRDNGNPYQEPSRGPRTGGNGWFPGSPRPDKGQRSFERKVRLRKWKYDWENGGTNITVILIALCTLIWAVEEIMYFVSRQALESAASYAELIPSLSFSRPWTMLTNLFLHAVPDPSHILFNMISLYIGGMMLERLLGHWEFLALYLISGFAGSVTYVIWWTYFGSGNFEAVLGASGAIFGLFGAAIVASAKMGVRSGMQTGMRSNNLALIIFLGLVLIVPMMFGRVAWQAHVGGAAAGAFLAWLMTSGLPALRAKSIGRRMWIYGSALSAALVVLWLVFGLLGPRLV